MNLEEKLNDTLNEILKTSGYVFEIISSNKRQSNIITGTNNQLISPAIISQLSNSIARFDDILDDTTSKFNDAKWCIESILETRQKEELKIRMEEEKQKKIREQEEKKRQDEELARKRREQEEERNRIEREKDEKMKEEAMKREKELEEKRKAEQERELERQREQKAAGAGVDPISNFMSPSFDFNLDDNVSAGGAQSKDAHIPNPTDILSSIKYDSFPMNDKDIDFNQLGASGDANDLVANRDNSNGNELEMNNILENDELILDGLNMSLFEQGADGQNNAGGNGVEEEFDVENFLNQFGDGE